MQAALRHHWFSEEEYLHRERDARDKSEYFGGHIVAMAGGSFRHNRLCAAVHAVLWSRLRGRPCQPSSSDQRLMTPGRLYTYPDAAVFCGRIEARPGTTDVATNPSLLVEVLSDRTREYDLGDKLDAYKQIPSLNQVLFLETERAAAVLVTREEDGWRQDAVDGLDQLLDLGCIGISVPLAELYDGLVGPDGPLPV